MIRPAELGDVQNISALWNAMITNTLSTFTTITKTDVEIADLLRARAAASFVAEAKGSFAGFVTFGAFRSGPGYAATAEHTILVAPQAQGKGIGRQLMEAAENAARAQGIHVMVAGLSHTNTGAHQFHQKVGYRETGRLPEVGHKAGQWLDLVLMQKIL